uniref:Uncharacterized protein n=1 Tax=Anguilla anguilla TaxID=7936 RepID=A0A0E9Q984_ANGAN
MIIIIIIISSPYTIHSVLIASPVFTFALCSSSSPVFSSDSIHRASYFTFTNSKPILLVMNGTCW